MNKEQVILALQQHRYPDETYIIFRGNYFVRANQVMIDRQEQRMRSLSKKQSFLPGDKYYPFPDDLKEFWLNVGSGYLTVSEDGKIQLENFNNHLLAPFEVADIMLEQGCHDNMDWDVFAGVFPFFNNSEDNMYSMTKDGRIIFGTEDGEKPGFLVCENIWEFYYRTLENPEWYVDME